MIFSSAIMAAVLVYTWIVAPIAPRSFAVVPSAMVVGLAMWHAARSGEWGLSRAAFLPAFWQSAGVTAAALCMIYVAGTRLGSWRAGHDVWSRLAVLVPWAIGQQFPLQTVFLREAQSATSKRGGTWLAGLMFGVLHLPNPFLAIATAGAALLWCWLYDRHPNVLPLALSHAMLTLAIVYAFAERMTGGLHVGAAYLGQR